MDIAKKYEGTKEIKGSKDNPVVVAFFAKSGHPEIKDDETAWCAAYVNAVLYEDNRVGTKSLLAKSFLKLPDSDEVTGVPEYGDIVVLHRGSPSSWQGHVGFFIKWDDDYVYLLGGNQSDGVNISRYSRDRIAGIRRLRETVTKTPIVPKITDKKEPVAKIEETVIGVGGAALAIKPLTEGDFLTGLVTIAIFAGIIGYLILKRRRS
jgi:uncharacterized protein (TIGR02594 family)